MLSLLVKTGVVVTKSTDSSDGLISNKKPRKAQQAKSMLYGCFVKVQNHKRHTQSLYFHNSISIYGAIIEYLYCVIVLKSSFSIFSQLHCCQVSSQKRPLIQMIAAVLKMRTRNWTFPPLPSMSSHNHDL